MLDGVLMKSPITIAQRREFVLELTRAGQTQRVIAEQLGVPLKTVANDRAALQRMPRGDPAWTPLPATCTPWPYGSTGTVVCARHGAVWGSCGRVAPNDPGGMLVRC